MSGAVHIYQDEDTGNRYYYNGKKLVYLGKAKGAQIGSRGNQSAYEQEKARHDAEVAKEMEASGEKGETEEEREARLKRIEDLLNNSDVSDEAVKEAEKAVALDKKKAERLQKIKASQEASYYTAGDIEKFKLDLKKFMKSQIKMVKKGTWKIENQKYADAGIIRKGTKRQESKTIPTINVYFDQSPSWGSSDIQRGKSAIGVLNEYVNKKQLQINVYYFANSIHSNAASARAESGTAAGKELIEHIIATKPKNVIVMTDSDFDHWGEIVGAPKVTVPGVAMFMFKNGHVSRELLKKLHGKQHNKIYDV